MRPSGGFFYCHKVPQYQVNFFTFSLINVIIAIIEFREYHILPEWLLIYKINENILILTLTRTENHSDLC
ncbi:type II toxin-antitoxin system mRNA interferase toxin, RelE/StbE family [Acidaminococcus sp. LBK-2]|uniref:type II toxin-antitoxin system mRNA interferase toxin, RelE/StbE family n=1 Tax=Acidaminococcus sp. LBK-2 TaxID=3456956 RepID=UPI003FA442B4